VSVAKGGGGLAHIDIESGVSAFTGKGFCQVRATGADGELLVGQLSPAEVRTMALHWLGAAEAAEHDAIVHAELVETLGVEHDVAVAFIGSLRKRREESDR
jgi:hypothetical protein